MCCPSCEFENPAGMKFCGQCATALTGPCPQCGFANPPGFAFLAEKILTSRSAHESERTQVTGLFVDMSEVIRHSKHLGTVGKPDTVRQAWAAWTTVERRWTEHDR
jgi:hypothetical protein